LVLGADPTGLSVATLVARFPGLTRLDFRGNAADPRTPSFAPLPVQLQGEPLTAGAAARLQKSLQYATVLLRLPQLTEVLGLPHLGSNTGFCATLLSS